MKFPIECPCRWFAAAVLAIACGTAAAAQIYPYKPIRFLLPFSPGGIGDLTARIVAQKMAENIGQNVVVDNRPGAGMIISATIALQSPADGYTMVLGGNGTAISQTLFKSLPYNILTDFTQVSTLASFDLVIVVKPESKLRSVSDLISAAKQNPGKLNLGTVIVGSTQNLSAELFKSIAGIQAQVVPYKGTPALVAALRADNIDVAFEFAPPTVPHAKAGQVRVLAVAAAKRHPDLPGVLTTAESGLGEFQVSSWNAVNVRIQTPAAIVKRLNKEIVAALGSDEVKKKLRDIGAEPYPSTPEQTRADEIRDRPLEGGDREGEHTAAVSAARLPLTLRPRRAEQVPSVLCLDATPERDAAPRWTACLCAPLRSHPQEMGPLLHVSAHLSQVERGMSCLSRGERGLLR